MSSNESSHLIFVFSNPIVTWNVTLPSLFSLRHGLNHKKVFEIPSHFGFNVDIGVGILTNGPMLLIALGKKPVDSIRPLFCLLIQALQNFVPWD